LGDFQSIIERYCPVVEKNVPVEISYQKTGTKCESCLRKHLCMQEHGTCLGFNQEN